MVVGRALAKRVSAFRRPELVVPLLAELLICAVQPLPRFVRHGIDSTLMHRQLGLLMFMRLYLFGRVFRNASDVYKNRHRSVVLCCKAVARVA